MVDNVLTHLISIQNGHYDSERVALKYRDTDSGEWCGMTWSALRDRAESVALSLCKLGIEPGDMVAVFSANRPENLLVDFGSYANRVIPVSIYSTSSADQVAYILNDCHAKILFVGNEAQYDIARKITDRCPCLKHIVCYGKKQETEPESVTAYGWTEFLGIVTPETKEELTRCVEKRTSEATPDDTATLIYTSGTTGEPKGAVLTHRCFDHALDMHKYRLDFLDDRDTALSFLPMSHIFEKAWSYFCLFKGIVVYINENPKEISDTLKQVRPSCMCSVPRFWEKAYIALNEKIEQAPLYKRLMFRWAMALGRRRNLHYKRLGMRVPKWLESRYAFYDKLVLGPVRKAMGVDNGRMFPTAGAPLSKHITEFFISLGVPILIGYGLSETTATVTCYPLPGYIVGTVGTRLDGVEVRIGADNEIEVKGPTVMKCYFNKDKETAEAFTPDGWFRTGDAGKFDEEGQLILTDRIKDLFKTSNGKYIAPQALESKLGADRYIEQVALIGDNHKYVSALVVPNFGAIKKYAQKHRIRFDDVEKLVADNRIIKMIWRRIERMQRGLPGYEKIKKIVLLPTEFTLEGGELTNTLKLRRRFINEKYADLIASMYV